MAAKARRRHPTIRRTSLVPTWCVAFISGTPFSSRFPVPSLRSGQALPVPSLRSGQALPVLPVFPVFPVFSSPNRPDQVALSNAAQRPDIADGPAEHRIGPIEMRLRSEVDEP